MREERIVRGGRSVVMPIALNIWNGPNKNERNEPTQIGRIADWTLCGTTTGGLERNDSILHYRGACFFGYRDGGEMSPRFGCVPRGCWSAKLCQDIRYRISEEKGDALDG